MLPIQIAYSPADVALSVHGNIISGFSDGAMVVVEREVDAFTKVVGADGEVSRTRSANKSGSVTITLKQDSDSNSILGAIAALDELTGAETGPLALTDLAGNTVFAANCWVKKLPKVEYGKDLTNREWVLECDNIQPEFAPAITAAV